MKPNLSSSFLLYCALRKVSKIGFNILWKYEGISVLFTNVIPTFNIRLCIVLRYVLRLKEISIKENYYKLPILKLFQTCIHFFICLCQTREQRSFG